MIISHNNTTKEISFTLADPDFGVGKQTGTITINCCDTNPIEVLPVIVRKIEVPLNLISGSYAVTSITINNVAYACTDATCSNIQTPVRAIYPNFIIASSSTASTYTYTMENIPVGINVSMLASIGGTVLSPTVQVLPAVFRLSGTFEINGIYSITVTKNIPETNGYPAKVISETACYFLDHDVICSLTDYISKEENKNTNVHLWYSAIKESVGCGCNCKDLCSIYKSILLELNLLDRCKIC